MLAKPKTVLVTGASQGIGAGVVRAFLDRGYNAVANSRSITKSRTFGTDGPSRARRRGHRRSQDGERDHQDGRRAIRLDRRRGQQRRNLLHQALHRVHPRRFQGVALDEPRRFHLSHSTCDRANAPAKVGREHRDITSAMVEHPIAGVNASLPMLTKGGLEAITRSLAMECTPGVEFESTRSRPASSTRRCTRMTRGTISRRSRPWVALPPRATSWMPSSI